MAKTLKRMAAILILVMMLVALVSCGGGNVESESESKNESESSKPVSGEIEDESKSDSENDKYSKGLKFTSNGDGTCTLSGIGTCTDAYVAIPPTSSNGELVTNIGDSAFSDAQNVKYILLPSSVDTIGKAAFGNCPSLQEIEVATGNRNFHSDNGVLYSGDLSTIYAYPAARSDSSVVIPVSVTEIKDMAFYGCKDLKTIKFAGTSSDWKKIKIGEKNYGIDSATVEFSKGK